MAKGIADGFPLSAFIAREEVADSFKPGDHLSTFGGNPVSCAAAVANIAYLQGEKVVENAAKKGAWLKGRLEELKAKHAKIGEVRGKGLMIGIELVTDRSSKAPGAEEAKKVRDYCLNQGLLIGLGGVFNNVLRIQPPLIIAQDQLEQVVAILDRALGQV
jgi:4-aminobutyrate aminotransferase-like enzyme